ncbi:phospholipid/cholesterol/gamma-HCH transport system substrate-binding protein [Haloechinothrix alba]|uniref:Phospholipid/cholesterol/gamma-HCH transport system substrate-binding protein n=1 Tax=Haloechinothrix alba TaxID=664784 RepID=A0A238VFJ2_9PSEU|nr:MCE family protein [Haloechinothrix alba]SNR33155.1 phospholipid/cholesterol/gamma-HCH transport system substrate-binding protein [Haloechinothrix alba]
MNGDESASRTKVQALGLVFLLVLGALGWLSVAIYDKKFASTIPVTLQAGSVGNQLKVNGDVKARGVLVGQIREVRTGGDGAEIELGLQPDKVESLPSNVSARMVRKTLFGPRYVELVMPEEPAGTTLGAGDVIERPRTATSIETEEVLNDLMPVLQAVRPHKLAASLGSVAQALDGRGESFGDTLVSLNAYLSELVPEMDAFQENVTRFGDVMETYDDAAPDVLDAMEHMTTLSETVVEQRSGVRELIGTVTTAAGDLDGFLTAHGEDVIELSANSKPTLELLAQHSSTFPCLAQASSAMADDVDAALGSGSGEPGLHVRLTVKDVSSAGGSGSGTSACPPAAGGGGSPMAHSVAEDRLVSELLAPAQGVEPRDVPGWSTLLVGPLLRGTEVTLE